MHTALIPGPDEENPSLANPASSTLEPPGLLRPGRFRSSRLGISPVIRVGSQDNVVVARARLSTGIRIDAEDLTIASDVPPGHKVAARFARQGEPIIKGNAVIGLAAADTAPGTHITS